MFDAPLWILFQSTSYALDVVADVPTTSHAIDLILIQDNPKPLNLRSVDEYNLISWIFKSNRYCAIATVPTGIEPVFFAVTGRRDNRYTTGPMFDYLNWWLK